MIAVTGKYTKLIQYELEGLSTDDKDDYLKNLSEINIGSKYLELNVDTGKTRVYTLNTTPDGTGLQWYKI